MSISIKQASNVDGLVIASLEHMLFAVGSYKYRNVIDMINNSNYYTWVICSSQRILGYCFLLTTIDELELIRIGIRPGFQNQGLGKLLLEHILDQQRLLGKSKIWLEVDELNVFAIKFYKACGFVQTGVRKKYYQNSDALIMLYEI